MLRLHLWDMDDLWIIYGLFMDYLYMDDLIHDFTKHFPHSFSHSSHNERSISDQHLPGTGLAADLHPGRLRPFHGCSAGLGMQK